MMESKRRGVPYGQAFKGPTPGVNSKQSVNVREAGVLVEKPPPERPESEGTGSDVQTTPLYH